MTNIERKGINYSLQNPIRITELPGFSQPPNIADLRRSGMTELMRPLWSGSLRPAFMYLGSHVSSSCAVLVVRVRVLFDRGTVMEIIVFDPCSEIILSQFCRPKLNLKLFYSASPHPPTGLFPFKFVINKYIFKNV